MSRISISFDYLPKTNESPSIFWDSNTWPIYIWHGCSFLLVSLRPTISYQFIWQCLNYKPTRGRSSTVSFFSPLSEWHTDLQFWQDMSGFYEKYQFLTENQLPPYKRGEFCQRIWLNFAIQTHYWNTFKTIQSLLQITSPKTQK